MGNHTARRIVIFAGLLAAAAGCSSGKKDSSNNTGGVTTTYAGTFADPKTSGSLTVKVVSSSAASQSLPYPTGISAQTNASSSATGTLVFLNGSTTSLSGSFAASAGTITMSGGGYSLAGTLASGALAGTINGPNGSGDFSTQSSATSAPAPKTYCGTYATVGDYGWFNLVISGSGNASGLTVSLLTATSIGLSGSVTGSTLTATSQTNAQIQATVSSDGQSLSGSYLPPGTASGTGTFQGSTGGCPSAGSTSSAGLWTTSGAASGAGMQLAFTQSGTSIVGSGVITVSIPSYTGNAFTITSGSISNSTVTFTATLGANPTGNGGFYYGSLSFTGTLTNATTMTGTLLYTPPRTASQTFSLQTVTGVTLTRN